MNYQGIQGFDISTWQDSPLVAGHVDFQRMKAWGANFVLIRAGQGNWYDLDFETSWMNAKGVLPRASYWYYDNRFPPQDQARKYFETIKGDLEGMCFLDLEDRQSGVYSGWRGWYDFIAELKEIYPGVRLGIYTGFYYWYDYITYATNAQRDYFGQYPLWLANYSPDPLHPHYTDVLIPLPWLDYLILQTGTPPIGEDVGVESKDVDYDQFNGDVNTFRSYFQLSGALPQEGTDTMARYTGFGTADPNLRVRKTYPDGMTIGAINEGQAFEGDNRENGWMHVITVGGKPLVGWASEQYLNFVDNGVTPPPDPVDSVLVNVDADISATINGKQYRGVVLIDNVQLKPVE